LDDKVVLVSGGGEDICVLNRTGADIWQGLEHPCMIGEVVDAVSNRYGTAPDLVRQDVMQFVETMRARGLIAVSEEDS
jgi:hypothetical protein